MIELAERALNVFSGDEDSLTIVQELSIPARPLRTARTLLMEVAEHLQGAAHAAARRRIA